MAGRELFVILNPHAAKGRAEKQGGDLIKTLLSQDGNHVELVYTKKGEGGAEMLAWQATCERRDAIIAAGGGRYRQRGGQWNVESCSRETAACTIPRGGNTHWKR